MIIIIDIAVCRLFSKDGEVLLRIEELISHGFTQGSFEEPCCILSSTFADIPTWFIKKPGQKFETECLIMPPIMVERWEKF